MKDCKLVKQVNNNTHKQDRTMVLQHSGKQSDLQHEPFLKGLEKDQKINYIIVYVYVNLFYVHWFSLCC